ncbi:MAG: hypothetical protein JST14_02885 [Bacteroidetes bacterium]|nr:hypothetical protein [Bacteroidota bacterium]
MNKAFRIVMLLSFLAVHEVWGQTDLDQILKGSQADANYLAQGYIAPFMNSIGSGLSQGWYNTAAVHKKLGVDLTVSASLIYFPSSDKSYLVDNNKLTTLKIIQPSNGMAPTIFGGNTPAPTYGYKDPLNPTTFQGPQGIDLGGQNAIPLPIFNLGVGLPLQTDLKIRFIPKTSVGSGTNVSLLGFGLMHDIKHYIPGLKAVPIDLSAFVGYTKFQTDVAFDPTRPDQIGKSSFSSTTVQAVISKKLSVLTLYGGAGYNFTKGTFDAKGKYDSGVTGVYLVDPVSVSSTVNGPRFTAGMRLKFAVFTLHGDYTFQRYNTLTVGFGISVR